MAPKSKPTKRKRGGQHGNQNARKHGFYSSILSPDEINSLGNLLNQEHIAPEMAVLRVKLESFIQQVESQRNTFCKPQPEDRSTLCSKRILNRRLMYDIRPKCTPADRRLIGEVSRLIVKWAVKKYRLNRADCAKMQAAVEEALERSSGIPLREPESLPKITENQKNESLRLVPSPSEAHRPKYF